MIARIEAKSSDETMTDVEVAEVVRDVAELYEPAAEEAGVTLTVGCVEKVTLKANRELLGQALANLVDNAIKHARGLDCETPLAVTVSAVRDGGDVVLSVADNGIGIPAKDHDAFSNDSCSSRRAVRRAAAASD